MRNRCRITDIPFSARKMLLNFNCKYAIIHKTIEPGFIRICVIINRGMAVKIRREAVTVRYSICCRSQKTCPGDTQSGYRGVQRFADYRMMYGCDAL